MRIAFISYEYPPDSAFGGIATYVHQAARTMAARGHEVEVFASSSLRQQTELVDGLTVHWLKEKNTIDFGVVAGHAFAKRHAERPFDVIEGPEYMADARKAHELAPDVALVVKMHTPRLLTIRLGAAPIASAYPRHAARTLKHLLLSILSGKIPGVIPLHPSDIHDAMLVDRMEQRHAAEADLVAPPCRDLCRHAAEKWEIPDEKLRLSPYPFVPSSRYLALKPGGEGFVVGFVGRVEKRKGVECLFRAIPMILKQVPQARFRFVGAIANRPGSNLPYDEWFQKKYPACSDKVEFAGKIPMDRLDQEYDQMAVAVFPSIWENFPNVCLEAMSAGRAIVASQRGGMAEMLDNGKTGKLIDPLSPRQLADAVAAYLESPGMRGKDGTASRERILSQYNVEVIGSRMEAIYRDAISLAAARNQG